MRTILAMLAAIVGFGALSVAAPTTAEAQYYGYRYYKPRYYAPRYYAPPPPPVYYAPRYYRPRYYY